MDRKTGKIMKINFGKLGKIILPLFLLGLIVVITTGADCSLKTIIKGNYSNPQNLTKEDIAGAINGAIDWMVGGVSGIATIFLLLGGLKYVISFGNPESAQSAKKTMTFAIMGLLAAWSAWMVIKFIVGFLQK